MQKLGSHGLGSLMDKAAELWKLEAQRVFCTQLNREAGLLYSAEWGGAVCSTQLSKDTGLANRSRSSL